MTKGYFANLDVDYTQEFFHDSLKLSSKDCMKVRHMILFSHFSNTLRVFELYGMRHSCSDTPNELTSVTGDLKLFCSLADSDKEYEWGLMNFIKYHDAAQEAVMRYMMLNIDINEFDEETQAKVAKLREIDKVSKHFERFARTLFDDNMPKTRGGKEIDSEKSSHGTLRFLYSVCIPAVKESKHHFPTYYKMVTGQTLDGDTFVDDIIKKASEPEL